MAQIITVLLITALASIAVGLLLRALPRFSIRFGPRRSSGIRPLTFKQTDAVAEAHRLWKSDPTAAHTILDNTFQEGGEREDQERAVLRARAATDQSAAEELYQRLQEDLEVWAILLKKARKQAGKDVTAQRAVTNLEQWSKEASGELAQLGDVIKKLSNDH